MQNSEHQLAAFSRLFSGKKEKWQPLFRRLAARLGKLPGIQLRASRGYVLIYSGDESFGAIWVGPEGIEVGLPLAGGSGLRSPRLTPSRRTPKRMNYRISVTTPGQIDDELLAWLRTARSQARRAGTSRKRST